MYRGAKAKDLPHLSSCRYVYGYGMKLHDGANLHVMAEWTYVPTCSPEVTVATSLHCAPRLATRPAGGSARGD